MKFIKVVIVLVILAGVLVFGAFKYFSKPVSDNNAEKEIEIPMGSGPAQIAKILKDNNLIKNELVFRMYVKQKNISNFKAGTYYLKESMTLEQIVEKLQTGIVYEASEITVTVIEGKPMWYLAELIEDKTNNTKEDVYDLLENEEYIDSLIDKYWFITDDIKNENIYYSLEGYLFPDTYELTSRDATVEEIFEKMLNRMEDILDDYKDEIEASEYSIHELLTIASVVEAESMNKEDRKNVASVIYNRLGYGMSLGSDVTTYYSVKANMGDRDLYQKEIDAYNPYNTRGPNMEGKLPVGPICLLSKSSIEAAIEPNNTDYLYFVADKNGKLYFTETNAEHLRVINELQSSGNWYEY